MLHSIKLPNALHCLLPKTPPSMFSCTLPGMLSRTLPIALDGTLPACLTSAQCIGVTGSHQECLRGGGV